MTKSAWLWLVVLVTVLAIALLTGCGSDVPKADTTDTVSVRNGKTVELVKLPDGTRCAVITSPRTSGIDCDWYGASNGG